MSTLQSIPLGLPDPMLVHPTKVAVPLSGIEHVTQSQLVNVLPAPAPATVLTAQQLTAPLLLNGAPESTGPFSVTLPAALPLFNAFGGVNQVQNGDVFEVEVVPLPSLLGPVVFSSGSLGGPVSVSAYQPNYSGRLHFQFNVSLNPFVVSYTLF